MWGLVLLLVFILILCIALRRRRGKANAKLRTRRIIAVFPMVGGVGERPSVVLPDRKIVSITLGGQGMRLQNVESAGLQDVQLPGMNVRVPVQLAREEPECISALNMSPDVHAVTLDFGTRQMILHDKEKQDGVQFSYTHGKNGQIDFEPLRADWSRIGSVGMTLDTPHSKGSYGNVACEHAAFDIRHSTTPSHNTVLGWQDVKRGKHRFVFNLKSKTAVVQ